MVTYILTGNQGQSARTRYSSTGGSSQLPQEEYLQVTAKLKAHFKN
jgi:hypothetical protein